MAEGSLKSGIYESLITRGVVNQLSDLINRDVSKEEVESTALPSVLAQHICSTAMEAFIADPLHAVELANNIIRQLHTVIDAESFSVYEPPSQLLRVSPQEGPGIVSYPNVRPQIPLAQVALLTNTSSDPSLGQELRAELDTSDHVDLLCAFVRWAGLRVLAPELGRLQERGGRIRVITTTYTGSTERRALDRLIREYGAEVRIQYDVQRTRLHAKAWMFHRNTRFDTAYVGSSNLTHAALLEGVEWNVRLSRVITPSLLDKFNATFETYWNDSSFEKYDPDVDAERLDRALLEAGGSLSGDRLTLSLSGLTVTPYPYQQEMLDELEAEREVHHRHRNLLVAATGTGKTVVAALDYRNLVSKYNDNPSILFVAHRKEILKQSLRTYREVLGDANFGELYVDGEIPSHWKHVFASIQSLNSYGVERLPSDAYDIVVIDEFHHSSAPTYRRLLSNLNPKELLGLTATPERADGINIQEAFFEGRIASELRLWDALGADLLCPFHYFGIADNTNLSHIPWSKGKYDQGELANLFTGNEARTRIILKELQDKVLDTNSMRALGFCVSINHSEYMAQAFNRAGIAALTLNSASSSIERDEAVDALRHGRVQILFVVDIFNEGIDIPSIDTILFLRPTESATIFLQQLGRGLRRNPNKAVLTVLDFVGFQNKAFRWDLKLAALTGLPRKRLNSAVDLGFPYLPSGCQIVLDKQTKAAVLDNIRAQLQQRSRWIEVVQELKRIGNVNLQNFLRQSGVSLSDILKSNHSWTRLRRESGFELRTAGPNEEEVVKRGRCFAHVDDVDRLTMYQRLLSSKTLLSDLSLYDRRLAEMLFFTIWPNGGGFDSIQAGVDCLSNELAAASELGEVIGIAFDLARHTTFPMKGELSTIPLRVHARYRREEILAALGAASLSNLPNNFREGVKWIPEINTDALFIQLKKAEEKFSPTTMYKDFPISPSLFHWESQSRTSTQSETGRRYLEGSSNILLFVRETENDEYGKGAPYLFLGPATHVRHEGERPIAITWRLATPMPTDFFTEAKLVAN